MILRCRTPAQALARALTTGARGARHPLAPSLPRRGLLLRTLSSSLPPSSSTSSASPLPPSPNGLLMAAAPGLRVVDLDRPQALNCLDPPMLGTLLPLLRDWRQPGSDVKLVALRGTGPDGQAFCAGTNLRFLHDCAAAGELPASVAADAPPRPHVGIADAFVEQLHAVVRALAAGRPPVVALCDGLVMGSGASLAMHSAVSIATENTLVAFPEAGLGGFPAAGASYTLPRLGGPGVTMAAASSATSSCVVGAGIGAYLALAGPRLSGRDAVAAGLATHYVRASRLEHLEGVVAEFARQAHASGAESADLTVVAAAARSLDAVDTQALVPPVLGNGNDSATAVAAAAAAHAAAGEAAEAAAQDSFLGRCGAEIAACFGGRGGGGEGTPITTSVAEVVALVNEAATRQRAAALAAAKLGVDPQREWEDPGAQWAVRAARELELASPTALAVTLELLRRGAPTASSANTASSGGGGGSGGGGSDDDSAGGPSLADCLQMESRVARRMMRHPDFVAGARAVIARSREGLRWAPPPTEGSGELEEWFDGDDGSGSGGARV